MKKGFTLLELLIVIAIVAIIVTLMRIVIVPKILKKTPEILIAETQRFDTKLAKCESFKVNNNTACVICEGFREMSIDCFELITSPNLSPDNK